MQKGLAIFTKKTSRFLAYILLFTLTAFASALEWNFPQDAGMWDRQKDLTLTESEEGIHLDLTGPYSNIQSTNCHFSTKGCEVAIITYEATGLRSNNGGYIFFGSKELPNLDEEKKFYVPPIIFDGEEHDLVFDLASHSKHDSYKHWQNASEIINFRLDLVGEFPANITIKSINFVTNAEYNKILQSKYDKLGIPLKVDVDMPYAKGRAKAESREIPGKTAYASPMVATKDCFLEVGINCIRLEFDLAEEVSESLLQTVCDDQLINAWLNGTPIEQNWSRFWKTPDVIKLSPNLFKKGRNVLAFEYQNTGSIGGIMADLQIIDAKGNYIVVTPEKAQGIFGKQDGNWFAPEYKCNWQSVDTRPGAPSEPWIDFKATYQCIFNTGLSYSLKVDSINNKNFQAKVTFTGKEPFADNDLFYGRLSNEYDQEISTISGTAQQLNAVKIDDNTVQVTFDPIGAIVYGAEATFKWAFGVKQRTTDCNCSVSFVKPDCKLSGRNAVLKVKQTKRGPVPMLNGKPFFFNTLTSLFLASSSSQRITGMEGHNSPFNVLAPRLGGASGMDWWIGPDKYDFSSVDRYISTIIKQYPDAYLGLYVWCHPGNWYRDVYPERISIQDDGKQYGYYVAAISFSNAEVRKDAQKALTALVQHMEKYFGPKVIFYNLMGGISCEWQGWSAHSDTFADYSEGATNDFIAFAKTKGVNVSAVPTREERKDVTGSIFRNPVKNRDAILYDEFYSESIAECITSIAAAVKKACDNKKLVGAYYGYLMEYASLGYCANGGGHNALKTVLESKDLDFFLSPQSYAIRALGSPNEDMKPYAAIREAGKFSILEDDSRTHLTVCADYNQAINLPMTLNILKRNIGMSLSRNTPLNQLPIVDGHDLDDPAIADVFKKSLAAGQYLMEQGHNPRTEIAAVIDADAIRYQAYTRDTKITPTHNQFLYNHSGNLVESDRYVIPISGELLYYQRINLAQIGAPVDIILLSDVERLADKYKMVIFLNAYKDKPELRSALAALRKNNVKTVITYGAGFIDDNGFSAASASACTGISLDIAEPGSLKVKFTNGNTSGSAYEAEPKFKVTDENATVLGRYVDSKDVAVAEKGNIVFYGGTLLDPTIMRSIAEKAGVHIFIDSEDNIHASKDIFSIHANHKGKKLISLPEKSDVIDVYSGEVVARNTDSFEIDMNAFDSRVFLLGKERKIKKYFK